MEDLFQPDQFTESARELHQQLGVKKNYVNWILQQFNRLNLKVNFDYQVVREKSHTNQSKITHFLTKAVSHRIAAHSEVKTEANANVQDNMALSHLAINGNEDAIILKAVAILQDRVAEQKAEIERKNSKIKELQPKADTFDATMSSNDLIAMDEVAKVLAIPGYGRNNLFRFLRNEQILRANNHPYQVFIDRGYFKVIERQFEDRQGDSRVYLKTMVTQKGLHYIRQYLKN